MSQCLCLVVTSGHLVVLVILMVYKCLFSTVPSDELEGSFVLYSVVDNLFVERFDGVFVLVSENGVGVAMSISGPLNLV